METNIAVFRGKEIRKMIHKNEWWFSIIDVIEVLTGSDRPRKYWSDLKNSMILEGYIEVSEKIGQLKMIAPDGKMRLTDCANTECTAINPKNRTGVAHFSITRIGTVLDYH
jgi:DNA-damage-inducible protein D